jgi:hypothetical protein
MSIENTTTVLTREHPLSNEIPIHQAIAVKASHRMFTSPHSTSSREFHTLLSLQAAPSSRLAPEPAISCVPQTRTSCTLAALASRIPAPHLRPQNQTPIYHLPLLQTLLRLPEIQRQENTPDSPYHVPNFFAKILSWDVVG